jgi:glycosyltransferase involved in cell wall biosynthesis
MPSVAPEVSVVCSTYNRGKRLAAMLTALEQQTLGCDRFEVVVVNDGSTDDTQDVLEKWAANSPLSLHIVRNEKNLGRSPGRNIGWRASVAPIVAFTDDDCAPDPDWLRAGLDALASTGAAVIVGRTEPNPQQTDNMGAFSRTQRVGEASGKRYFQTCNIFYRRDDLVALDGFDERYSTKGGEDTDLGWRVLDRGGQVDFAADALVLHDITVGSFGAALKEASMWLDIPRVTKLHKVRAKPLLVHRFFWKKTHELVILAVGGITLAVVVRNPIPLLAVIPWARFRLRKWPIVPGTVWKRASYLPHAFLIDAVEVSSMVRGSIRDRVIVL